MSLGKRSKHNKHFVSPRLQITAMMDMFTIILIFLLFSFSENPETMTLDKDLELPKSSAKMDYTETIKLALSQKNLKLQDRIIAELDNGKIKGLNPDKVTQSDLYRELKSYREDTERFNPSGKKDAPILFLCDKRIPFKTVNNIIKTAGLAGFPNFQFAVLKK